jgi:DNA-binding transcriptional LysR family regulator
VELPFWTWLDAQKVLVIEEMELRHLRYFIAVAEELNFSRAAARLHVSQPPLSRQIRSLEAELKVKLLDRNTQEVRLTRVGYAVLARSRKLVRDAESLRAEAQMIEKESQEELRIGYATSVVAISELVVYRAREFPSHALLEPLPEIFKSSCYRSFHSLIAASQSL